MPGWRVRRRLEGQVGMNAFALVVVAVVAVFGLIVFVQHWHRQRLEDSLGRLLARDPGLAPTVAPIGFAAAQLADGFVGCPRGDRRYGIRWGVEGPMTAQVAGQPVAITCAAFEWWWEERHERRDANGNNTSSYTTHRRPVAAARLPVTVPDHVRIGPESVFGRLGLSRTDHQLESDTFNRRFKVQAEDRMLTVQLLDAGFQQLLLDRFQGRTIELLGGLLVIAGDPGRRDDTLTGCIGQFPAVREDTTRLLAGVPAQFWRALDRQP